MMERNQEVDIAKGIGMLLVVIGHSVYQDGFLHAWIYSFHMPLFFILSGLVMRSPKELSIRQLLRKNCRLAAFYIFWSLVYLTFDLIIRGVLLHQRGFYMMFWETYQTLVLYGISTLWFISTLAISKVIACILIKRFRSDWLYMCFGGILYICSIVVSRYLNNIQLTKITAVFIYPLGTIVRSLSMILFLLLGYTCKRIYKIATDKMCVGGYWSAYRNSYNNCIDALFEFVFWNY